MSLFFGLRLDFISNSQQRPDYNLMTSQEKQMEVCEVCGAFLIIGDAQSRVDDHLMGKQHQGYAKIKTTVEELKVRKVSFIELQLLIYMTMFWKSPETNKFILHESDFLGG